MKRFLPAMIAVLGISISALAQGGGGGGTGGGGGGGGTGGGGTGKSGAQASTVNSGISTLDFSKTTAGLASIGTSSSSGSKSTAVSATNAFAPFMANPLYPGRPGSTALDIAKGSGGFGTQSFGSTTTGANNRGGAATTTTGGRAGGTNRGGSSTNSFIGSTSEFTGGNLGYGTAPQIAYTAVLKFEPRPVVQTEVQAQVQGLFDRTSMLSNKDFKASVEDGVVVLRGKAKNRDEKMLAEGMARLTPGVQSIRNEIEVP